MSRTICYLLVLALTVGTIPVAPRTVSAEGLLGSLLGGLLGSTPVLNRMDATLRGVVASGTTTSQRVIITTKPGARPAMKSLLTSLGRTVIADHPAIESLSAVVAAEDLEVLASYNSVVSIAADHVVRPTGLLDGLLGTVTGLTGGLLTVVGQVLLPANGDVSGPVVYPSLVRSTLGLQSSQWTGRGIGVAVVDSGLEMSSEFRNRVTGFYDFTKGGADAVPAYDDYGHGTHVASLIGGSGALSYNAAHKGLAPNVRFTILKALDKNGAGYTSDVIRAIDFAVEKRAQLGIHIINLSLGHPIAQPAAMDPLVQAVERASRAGLIVVVAAGNMGINPETGKPGYAGITSPGNAPSAITVGAAKTLDTVPRNDDRIPDYSSSGPTWYDGMVKPDLLAPGHNLVAAAAKQSTIYSTYPKLRDADSDYIRLSGTSMATAVASGAIAQMLEAQQVAGAYDGPLTPNAVKAALQYTALGIRNDQGIQYDRLRKGAGSLNGKGAIDVATRFDASSNGRSWLTSMPSPWTTIGGQSQTWNQSVIWGSGVIWGSTLVWAESQPWATSVIWGSGVIWGSSLPVAEPNPWATSVIWGSTLVWADSATWANSVIWGSNTIGYTNGSGVIWGSTTGLTPGTTAWADVSASSVGAQ
jgi:serine protease AprX